MNDETVTLNVCEDIDNGREPFSKIMNAVRQLRSGQNFLLVAPFKPVPLFGVLAKLGFRHEERRMEDGCWEVLFTHDGERSTLAENPHGVRERGKTTPSLFVDVDARGLEPPQPMVKILEALVDLPENAGLRAHTDRRPMHLYAHLEARGFTGQSEEQKDGSFITHIRRS